MTGGGNLRMRFEGNLCMRFEGNLHMRFEGNLHSAMQVLDITYKMKRSACCKQI